MPDFIISTIWDESEGGNVEHIAEHGVDRDEVEHVLRTCFNARSRSRSNPAYWVVKGFTPAQRLLVVVFDYVREAHAVIPITAYEPEPES